MPTSTSYYSTHDIQGKYGAPIDGLWTVTQRGFKGGMYQKFLTHQVGPNTPVAQMGGPVYQGPNLPRSHMESRYNISWKDMRLMLKLLMISKARDPGIIQEIKLRTHKLIPVRSGKLLNTIFKTMRIDRSQWYHTHFFVQLLYDWPADRPHIIKNPQHIPPAEGYGDWSGVRLTEPEAIAAVDPNPHVTPMGNALYKLNDPVATRDPAVYIDRVAKDEFNKDYIDLNDSILITCTL